jgi:nucleoid-associated protein YgaU
MGLFDFFKKDAGEELTDTVEVSPERINGLREQSISGRISEIEGVDAQQVSVSVKGEIATLSGAAPSQEALEKMVLCAGNQKGIASVDCQLQVAEAEAAPAAAATAQPQAAASGGAEPAAGTASAGAASTFYTVQPGDTLGKIAQAHYGAANKYNVIFEANRPMLKDPDRIYPGQTLRIPPQ